jgi:hypothetical protein
MAGVLGYMACFLGLLTLPFVHYLKGVDMNFAPKINFKNRDVALIGIPYGTLLAVLIHVGAWVRGPLTVGAYATQYGAFFILILIFTPTGGVFFVAMRIAELFSQLYSWRSGPKK